MKQPANATPARCFNLSEIYAHPSVVADAATKMGITRDCIFLAEDPGLRTETMVGAKRVHEYTLEMTPMIMKALELILVQSPHDHGLYNSMCGLT